MGEELDSNQKVELKELLEGSSLRFSATNRGKLVFQSIGFNAVTQFDTYLTPHIEELIDHVGRAKFITTLDLKTGYWQIPISTKATFQRLMDRLLWV